LNSGFDCGQVRNDGDAVLLWDEKKKKEEVWLIGGENVKLIIECFCVSTTTIPSNNRLNAK